MAKSAYIIWYNSQLVFTEGLEGVRSIQEKYYWGEQMSIKIYYDNNTYRTFWNCHAIISDIPSVPSGIFQLLKASISFTTAEINTAVRKTIIPSPAIGFSIQPVWFCRISRDITQSYFVKGGMIMCFGQTPANIGTLFNILPTSGPLSKFMSLPVITNIQTAASNNDRIDRSNSSLDIVSETNNTGGSGTHYFDIYYYLISNMSQY